MKAKIHGWLRAQMPMLIGGSLLILAIDACVLLFRVIGLPRETALYAGLLTFVLLGTILARVALRPHASNGETDNG